MLSRKDLVWLSIILFLCLFASPAFSSQPQESSSIQTQGSGTIPQNKVELTQEEKAFLQSHQVIRLGTDETWEPFVSSGADGTLRGVDVDFIQYINESTGSHIQLVTGSWADMVKKAKNHEIDGLVTSAPLEAREPYFNFSHVYVSEFMLVLLPFDSALKITELSDLSGKTVAVQKGNEAYSALLKPYPGIKVVEADSEIESAKMVVEGKADASITGTSSYKIIHGHFLQSIKIGYVATEKPLDLVYSIRKDWPELVTIVNKSLESLPRETLNTIYLRWFGMSPPEPVSDKRISTTIVDNYYPYTFVNETGEPDGFSVDLMKAAAQVMGVEIRINVDSWEQARNGLKTGEIDFLPMMAYSKERDQEFDFSAPHTIAYDAFFIRKGSPVIKSLKDLRQKKIIVMKNDQAHDYLRSLDYITDDQLIFTDDLQDALRMLAAGKGDAALMPKLVGLTFIKKLNLTNLELAPLVIEEYRRPFGIAVKEGNQELLERLSQGLSILKETDQQKEIYEKWFGIYKSSEMSFTDVLKYFFWFILAFILFGVIFFFWFVSLKRQVSIRTKDLKEEIEERKRVEEALRENEKKYRRLVEKAVVGVYQVTREGGFRFVNEKMAQMFGYDNPKRFLAEVVTIVDLYVRPEERTALLREMDENGSIHGREVEFRKKDGGSLWVALSSRGIREEIYEGLMEDITERKRAEIEKEKLQSQLQQSRKMEAVGTLAGGIAHDFNNILAVILGNAELASSDVPDWNPASKSLKAIHQASLRAKDMVQKLLAFSRKSDGEIKPLRLTPVIKESMEMLRHVVPTSVEFAQRISDDPCNILGDAAQINQIVMNMVTNAAHAMSEEGGLLEVTLEKIVLPEETPCFDFILPPGPHIRLKVRDTGKGIEPKILARIFDPYYTTKEVGKGTGMGLSVVHGIVKGHDGGIRVESESGEGTVFEIYFPALEKMVAEEEKPGGETKGGSERVLFVDDEESMVDLNHQRLTRLGYEVKSTTNPLEALEWFKADPDQFHAVITDMTMPHMTGDRLIKEILAIRPHMPTIICTGYSEKMSEKQAVALGARKYLEKPMETRELAVSLREVLDG